MAEAVVFGRSAMGETVRHGMLTDHWRLRRDGRLAGAAPIRLNGSQPVVEVVPKAGLDAAWRSAVVQQESGR